MGLENHDTESRNAIESQQSEFSVKRLHVLNDGQERTVDCLNEAAVNPSFIIIGVTCQLPVGGVSIGTSRNSNSHADAVE